MALAIAAIGAIAAGTEAAETPRPGVCVLEGRKVVGTKPAQVGRDGVRSPRKLRDVHPKYPALPADTRADIRSIWVGELLIDAQGRVSRIWTIQGFRFTPPFPAFNRAIVDAVGRWEFEPVAVDGKAVPACMTVSVGVNWQ